MKKLVFKKWVEQVVASICFFSIMLIAMSIESDWTLDYLKFVLINLVIAGVSGYLLSKFGRKIEEDDEEC